MSKLRNVYTDQFTIKSGHIDVGDGHKVYFEQWGKKNAKTPIVVFHGGPGSNYKAKYKDNFDPGRHQVILFDQRGCGNSIPYGKTKHNTTQDLISDAKKILDHLKIKKVHLFGGSWGSTMALLFNISYPLMAVSVIVRGIFLGNHEQIEYIDKGYFRTFYPEVWDRFVASVPSSFRDCPAQYHYAKVKSKNTKDIVTSSKALEELETPLLSFEWPGYSSLMIDSQDDETYNYVPYQIYAHYLSNNCFLPDEYIMEHVSNIKNPVYIIQGRYDMVCPPMSAYRLHQAIPQSKLYITHASHGNDPENATASRILIDHIY